MAPRHWPNHFVYACESISYEVNPHFLRLCLASPDPEHEQRVASVIEAKCVHPQLELRTLRKGHPLANRRAKEGHIHRGVFAKAFIDKGEPLGEYVGEIILKKRDDPAAYLYFSRIFSDYAWKAKLKKEYDFFVEPKTVANELAFVNDYRGIKEKPNVAPKWVIHRGIYYFCYVTVSAVEAGEELLVDYGEKYWSGSRKAVAT